MSIFLLSAAMLLGCGDRPSLPPITAEHGIYLARTQTQTTITSDGLLTSIRTDNKSYGPRDVDPRHERVTIRQGRLTPTQVDHLRRVFNDWESLPTRYAARPDDIDIRIRYGEKLVTGGSDATPLRAAHVHIEELAQSMPVVNR